MRTGRPRGRPRREPTLDPTPQVDVAATSSDDDQGDPDVGRVNETTFSLDSGRLVVGDAGGGSTFSASSRVYLRGPSQLPREQIPQSRRTVHRPSGDR